MLRSETTCMARLLQASAEKIYTGQEIDRKTALTLAREAELDALCALADTIRRRFMGDRFELCSIINAKSGNCSENCRFCAQSARHHTEITTYTILEEGEVLRIAQDNDRHGVERLSLVSSGRGPGRATLAQLRLLYDAMAQTTGLRFCASAGLLDSHSVQALCQVRGNISFAFPC